MGITIRLHERDRQFATVVWEATGEEATVASELRSLFGRTCEEDLAASVRWLLAEPMRVVVESMPWSFTCPVSADIGDGRAGMVISVPRGILVERGVKPVPVLPAEPQRWSALRETLPAGISGETLELIRKATAPERHRWRIATTIGAAIAKVGGDPDELSRCDATRAATILALDMHGVGGVNKAGGESAGTARLLHPGGTGRWNALDGVAWRAAAVAAQSMLAGHEGHPRGFGVPSHADCALSAYATPDFADTPPDIDDWEGPKAVINVLPFLDGKDEGGYAWEAEFARAYARHGILAWAKHLVDAESRVTPAPRQVIAEWDCVLRVVQALHPPDTGSCQMFVDAAASLVRVLGFTPEAAVDSIGLSTEEEGLMEAIAKEVRS